MAETDQLKDRKILIADDEPDILDALEDILYMCEIERTDNFDDAWDMLGTRYYDLAMQEKDKAFWGELKYRI